MTIILIILAVLVIAMIGLYNRLVKLNVRTDEAWADIDIQLKRRYDLIPNLIETVKAYASHEQSVFERVTEARAKAMSSGGAGADHAQAENMLTDALKSVFAVAEAYPELKANENFLELQRELSDTENKIQAARRFYNAMVRDMNIAVQSFPNNVLVKMLGFGKKEFFELEEGSEERETVKVDFEK